MHIQGKVREPAEVHFGFGAVGADRASAGRYLATQQVRGEFDVEIPVSEFQLRGERGETTSAVDTNCGTPPDSRAPS